MQARRQPLARDGCSHRSACVVRRLTKAKVAAVIAPSVPPTRAGTPEEPLCYPTPTLLTKLVKAHAARVCSLQVLKDGGERKVVISAGLDKTLLKLEAVSHSSSSSNGNGHSSSNGNGNGNGHHLNGAASERETGSSPGPANRHLHLTRLQAPGGPVFALARQRHPAEGSVFNPSSEVVYIGNASKEVVAWEVRPAETSTHGPCDANFQLVATGYTGWVRALALMGKWLFSCGCNWLVVHDTSHPIPQEVDKTELFKGDIQAIAASSTHVYVACSDGVLRSWTVSKKGKLDKAAEVRHAHDSRICGLALHGCTLYSVGHDGWLKAWNTDTLQLLAAVPDAHDGAKVHAIACGADGLLYTGGDDKLIRCWRPLSAALDFLAQLEHKTGQTRPSPLVALHPARAPLKGHEASVRVLAAGSKECLVSGDSEGDVCIWTLPRPVL